VVERLLDSDHSLIHAAGAHGISLMAHAALSGKADLVQMLFARGAHEGMSFALVNAVSKGHVVVVRWILTHGAHDLGWRNYQGKTALDIATARGDTEIIQLLKAHGAG
jgi:ankyrin repeat protein